MSADSGRDVDAGDVGSIAAEIGVTGVAGFDGGDFAVAEGAKEDAQAPAGDGHVVGGEKQLDAILGRIGFFVL